MLAAAVGTAVGQLQKPSSPSTGQVGPEPQQIRVRVSENVSQAFLARKVQPRYPQEARDKQVEGTVLLKAEISAEGDVTEVTLISVDPLLVQAALNAVKQWKYRPYLLNDRPVNVETRCTVEFRTQPPQGPSSDAEPTDAPALIGVVGDVPGGIPGGQTNGAIDGIISSIPRVKRRADFAQRIRVSPGVSQSLLVKKVEPVYPFDARRARIHGKVVLHILITTAGDVATVKLVIGNALLPPAAMDAVKQWKYKPFLLQGLPLQVDTEVVVSFTPPPN